VLPWKRRLSVCHRCRGKIERGDERSVFHQDVVGTHTGNLPPGGNAKKEETITEREGRLSEAGPRGRAGTPRGCRAT